MKENAARDKIDDGIFVPIRKGKGAWNDYAFNAAMFFCIVFGYAFAALKTVAIIILFFFITAFLVSLL